MKLNYKNVELEVMVVEEKEKILVKTQNLELAKALREQGVEVLMKHTIDSFVSFYNLTLIDKKKGLVYQNLKTIGRVLKVNPFFAKGKTTLQPFTRNTRETFFILHYVKRRI